MIKNNIFFKLTFLSMFILISSCSIEETIKALNEQSDNSPSVTLLSPLEGGVYNELQNTLIRWEKNNLDLSYWQTMGSLTYYCYDFNFPYSSDRTITTLSLDEINGLEYIWETPNVNADYDSCIVLLKIAGSSDTSGFFTIKADSTYLELISPNGGEEWNALSQQTIKFKKWGDLVNSSYLSLSYSVDDGNSYNYITQTSNDSSYVWNVPDLNTTNNFVKIKIYREEYSDESDNTFTIKDTLQSSQINILSPNIGDEWHEQTDHDILWNSEGDIGGNEVFIGYSHNGGYSWRSVIDNGSATTNPPTTSWTETDNDGIYNWSIPNYIDTSFNGLIGIWSAANTNIYKTSSFFTLTTDSNFYRIIQPNGGEVFQKNSNRTIIWESGGDVDDVRLYYSLFGGDSWYEIETSSYSWGSNTTTSNDGAFLWDVPSVQGTNDVCKIRIESESRVDWFDVSDATFTIADTAIFEFDMGFETGENFSGWEFDDNCTVDIADAFDGSRSAVFGRYGNLSKTKTVESGIIRFFVKSNSASYLDSRFEFYINGEEVNIEIDHDLDGKWQIVEYFVDAGTYDFNWYWDYSSTNYYLRVDNISFP